MPGQIRNLGPLAQALSRLQQNLYAPPPNAIQGVDPNNWPSALQPVAPLGPKGSQPLAFTLWQGQNLNYTPRPDAEYDAATLKTFATYELARFCIENTKDILCDLDWEIQLEPKPGESKKQVAERGKGDGNILNLSRFFEYPDGDNDWSTWLRLLLEDLLVIDAASVLLRRQRDKQVAELRVMPGDTIAVYVDDNGYMPKPPSPAYAQLWMGIPRTNLTSDQLVYKPRNIVRRNTLSSQLYGMSPVEQAVEEIKIGIARLAFVLAYYTAGSIPDMVHVVPSNVPPDKITEAVKLMNSLYAGQLDLRRGYSAVQGFLQDGKDQILFPKEKLLSDPFDDLHIRRICFAFGTSPQRLLKMMTRATAEQNQEAAQEEGTRPWANWLASTMNFIIQRRMGFVGYRLVFKEDRENDVLKRAQADASDVDNSIIKINEAREARGMDPDSNPLANQLLVKTAQGYVPLGQVATPPGPGGPASNEPGKGKEGEPKPAQQPPQGKQAEPGKTLLVERNVDFSEQDLRKMIQQVVRKAIELRREMAA